MRKKADSLHSEWEHSPYSVTCASTRTSYIQTHTSKHTHTRIHIDHRTCHKMSKSDYLINVYSTRRWPAWVYIFFSHMLLRVSVARLIFAINLSMCLCFMGDIKSVWERERARPYAQLMAHIGGAWSVAARVFVCACEYAVHKGDLLCACLNVCIFDIDSVSMIVRWARRDACVRVCVFIKIFFYFSPFSLLFHSIEIHSYNNIYTIICGMFIWMWNLFCVSQYPSNRQIKWNSNNTTAQL